MIETKELKEMRINAVIHMDCERQGVKMTNVVWDKNKSAATASGCHENKAPRLYRGKDRRGRGCFVLDRRTK